MFTIEKKNVATGVVDVHQRSVTSPAPPSSESTSSVVVREVSDSTMLGGGSLFCSLTFQVTGEDQLNIYTLYTVPRGEKT